MVMMMMMMVVVVVVEMARDGKGRKAAEPEWMV